jgi:hypothetical protein
MKIALILFGFLRTFEFCKQSFVDNLVNPLDVDVFISTPETVYTQPKDEIIPFHKWYSINSVKVTNQLEIFGDHLKSKDIRAYDSNFYKKAANRSGIPEINPVQQYAFRVLSQMHNITLSVNLFKKYVESTNSKYDLVILTRPDVKFQTLFNPNVVDLNKINGPKYILIHPNHPELKNLSSKQKYEIDIRKREGAARVIAPKNVTGGVDRFFNDQIICGSQNNILAYHDYYDESIKNHRETNCFNPETFMGLHLLRKKIEWTFTDFVLFELYRSDFLDESKK